MYITKDTISTIRQTINNVWVLTFYKDRTPVFKKEYKTFTAARIAESKLMKKYY